MFDDDNGIMLHDPLSIGDLVKDGGCFEINSKFEFEMEDDVDIGFESKEGQQIDSPWASSFEELKQQMTLLPGVDIHKKIVKVGNGKRLQTENARITMHYNGYWENETNSFDSSYMRGSPMVFNVSKMEVLPGIELAVKSMCEGEEAQFVISYKLLFGELGCPTRIKPKADGLFIINLMKISETGDETGVDQLSEADKRKFAVVMPKVRDIHTKGLDAFKLRNWPNACRLFHKALLSLECCQLANIDEQKEQQSFIVKMYTNLAVCYNLMDLPAKTCLMCNEISRISDISSNCKALFQEGRALLKLGEFKKAKSKLMRAQSLSPSDETINAEIRLLAKKYQNYIDEDKKLCQQAFGNITPLTRRETPIAEADDIEKEFKAMTLECLTTFRDNATQSNMQLVGLSTNEVDCVKSLIKDMPIQLKLVDPTMKKYTLLKTTRN